MWMWIGSSWAYEVSDSYMYFYMCGQQKSRAVEEYNSLQYCGVWSSRRWFPSKVMHLSLEDQAPLKHFALTVNNINYTSIKQMYNGSFQLVTSQLTMYWFSPNFHFFTKDIFSRPNIHPQVFCLYSLQHPIIKEIFFTLCLGMSQPQ